MSVNSISSVAGSYGSIDSEYKRIIEQLRALGIEPTGNKSTDKMKLQQALRAQKTSDVQQSEFVSEVKETDKTQAESSQDYAKGASSVQAQQMTGATQISDYNKYKLLGIY